MSRHHPQPQSLDLIDSIMEAMRLLPVVWRWAWGALGLWTLAAVGGVLATGTAAGAAFGLLGAVAALAASGAVLRLGIAGGSAGARALGLEPAGLQLGRVEARLLGTALLCLLFLFMILALLGLTLLAVAGAAELNADAIQARDWAAVGAPWKLAVVAVVGVGALVIPVMLAARLAMAAPATVALGRMMSLPAMAISRGNVRPLTIGLLLAASPSIMTAALNAPVLSVAVLGVLQVPFALTFLSVAYRRLAGGAEGEDGTVAVGLRRGMDPAGTEEMRR